MTDLGTPSRTSPPPGATDVKICADPIFVIGAPLSGTSEVAWALGQHSELWTSGETDYLLHLFGNARLEQAFENSRREGSFLQAQAVSLAEFAERLGHGANALLTSRSLGRRWIDQTPSYTEMLPLINVMFPRAQFIHVLRDGRRAVNAMLQSGVDQAWAKEFREACRTWSLYVHTALAFQVESPGRCFTVRYEALHRQPRDAVRALLTFLRVRFEEGPSDFVKASLSSSDAADASLDEPLTDEPDEIAWSGWTDEQRQIYLDECLGTLLLSADSLVDQIPAGPTLVST